ncbi:MAG: hypothetical protein HA496_06695 [Thaumarchaeota archaeon]|jgi:hypothetical protein|nr:hypothetical protein [Nitrososphaerota archaeon]
MKTSSEKCIICGRNVETGSKPSFCSLHLEAYRNIVRNYEAWRSAYGGLTPEEFLRRLENNDYTGKWVKEVVRVMLSNHGLLQFFLNDLSYSSRRG